MHRQVVDNTEKKITHKRILNEWARKTKTKKKFQRKKNERPSIKDKEEKKNKYSTNNGTLFFRYTVIEEQGDYLLASRWLDNVL